MNKPCLDCIREENPEPRPRSGRTSYCTKHTYVRTRQSKMRRSVQAVTKTKRWELLGEKDRNDVRLIPLVDIITASVDYEEKFSAALHKLLAEPYDVRQAILTNVSWRENIEHDLRELAYTWWCLERERDLAEKEMTELQEMVKTRLTIILNDESNADEQ